MPLSRKLPNDGERVVVSTRTHPKALLAPLLALLLLAALAAGVGVLVDTPAVRYAAWAVAALAALRLVGRPVLVWLSASYTFTDQRLVVRTGLLARREHDLPLARISDVEAQRDAVDRLLGCGTLVVGDAITLARVALPDIPQVEQTKRRVQALLHDQLVEASTRHEGI